MEISVRFICASLLAVLCAIPCVAQETRPHAATVVVGFDRQSVTPVLANGFADPATGRAVTADDPVRVASISKLAVAIGVMTLVNQGKLDLDADVSAYLGWSLRNPAFPQTRIRLRDLLSHRSTLTDDADYLIPLGETLQAHLAKPGVWDERHAPRQWFRYANINFPVVATIMERVTGERFDRLMQRLVFSPLELDACFGWTSCSDAAIARAVVLTNPDGKIIRDKLDGKRPDCPSLAAKDGSCDLASYVPGTNGALFSPQGGMRISARGLARMGQWLMTSGTGKRLAAQGWSFDGGNGDTEKGFFCRYALAIQTLASKHKGCADDPFGDGRARIGHAGDAYRVKAGLWYDQRRKSGIAYFTTAVAEDAATGRSAFTAAEEAVIQSSRD